MERIFDIAVIGGGIVGTATAMALLARPGSSLVLLETETRLAAHQTGNNSGVIHSGLYYRPGSLKAKNCVEGRALLLEFCREYGIHHDICGKLVVAVRTDEVPRLEDLIRRGAGNGLEGLRRLSGEEIREIEPHVRGVAGLFVPQTGIVDFVKVTEAFADCIRENGGDIRTGTRFLRCIRETDSFVLETTAGKIRCRNLVNCAGLHSDRVARRCGLNPDTQIIPFRGEYYAIVPERRHLVKNLVYPVPDPQFPFLGVHFTRMIDGEVEAGPNAVLAFKREGYRKFDISIRDMIQYASFPGFWRMAARHWKMGFDEFHRSFCRSAFIKTLKRLIPEIEDSDIRPGDAGVRAQALDRSGSLLDDFKILRAERMIHVLNAPSPAATASISIGRTIAGLAGECFSTGNSVT
ncbi:L-2-hydroxyglutarate oxidase [bacterium]|nr:L-2-hydroxyglutarate oxidase [candidate division CSSED10-310 bacterium]